MHRALTTVAAAAFATAAFAQSGHIIAIGDEWLLSDQAFIDQPAQSLQLANNIGNYFNGATSNFLVLSNIPLTPALSAIAACSAAAWQRA
ncbi:MAG TPA: hypothetical protein VEB22_06840 [Phycisphaerales bacterium]|nr:hypothetical protein [Phycisphaerales bacterium]